ncbi:TipJ family phage tail tip protein [Methylobrevis pamukkalensis]|uniref:Tip attachment protein J HDII-ins2 domain-containing protein n=1 Tax=Methylobrevis pamukkalensis TaxID=1439726 RepID=A0A1E3H492_9HYPH|nr:phage tail protein [Methylobrevis pamukkalensis]ODN71167.1 hypothetical protein A6302_01456 [Methylobrevis pamukkalensis]
MQHFSPPDPDLLPPLPAAAAPRRDAGASVTTLGWFSPEIGRHDFTVLPGMTIAEIVAQAMPGLTAEERRHVRVILVSPRGQDVVEAGLWTRVRPLPATRVVIRMLPGRSAWRSILQLVVTVAAFALGQWWAAGWLGASGSFLGLGANAWGGIIGAGLSAVGALAINALFPLDQGSSKPDTSFAVTGWQNQARPDAPVPNPYGRHRMAPPFAASSYFEVVGTDLFVRALFVWGYGPIALSGIRIGDTPIEEFDEVEHEFRPGRPEDLPVTLYPNQVVQEPLSITLRREMVKNDKGEIQRDEPVEDDPFVVVSGRDATELCAIFQFSAGLSLYSVSRSKSIAYTVAIKIEQRPVVDDDDTPGPWDEVETLEITENIRAPFWRSHRWTLPARGTYEVRFTRMTNETEDPNVSDQIVLNALQTIRPEYPLNVDFPLAISAIRVKSTYQLNGQLDSLNAIVQRLLPTWDGEDWVEAASSSPATAFRDALTGAATDYPEPLEAIGESVTEWAEWCALQGLKYDRIHDYEATLQEVLLDICRAGRAAPRWDGEKWQVVIDRPTEDVIAHMSPANSRDYRWSAIYPRLPHAFRVPFIDASNDWQSGEMLVPFPDHTGPITRTEELKLPGKTDPDEIFREATRRQYEVLLRSGSARAIQDGVARIATRGDRVAVSLADIDRAHFSPRVKAVVGDLVAFEGASVVMEAGKVYAIRFRVHANADDVVGRSVVRKVATVPGDQSSVRMLRTGVAAADAEKPAAGEIVHFGIYGEESRHCIVRRVEAGDAGASVFHLVDYRPEIDTLTAARPIPPWDGRVGEIVAFVPVAPAAPVVISIETTRDVAPRVVVALNPGPGSAPLTRWQVDHRAEGAGSWSTATVSSAATPVLTGYALGDDIEIRARGLAPGGTPGAWGPVLAYTVGEAFAAAPADLAVELVVEATSETTVGVYSLFSWSAGGDGWAYELEWQRWDGTTGGPLSRGVTGAGETTLRTGHLAAYAQHRARIRALPDDDDPSDWSGWLDFVTATAPVGVDDDGA